MLSKGTKHNLNPAGRAIILFICLFSLVLLGTSPVYGQTSSCIEADWDGALFSEGDMKPGDVITETVTVSNQTVNDPSADPQDIPLYFGAVINTGLGLPSPASQEEFLEQMFITVYRQDDPGDILYGPALFTTILDESLALDTITADESAVTYAITVEFPAAVEGKKWYEREANFNLSLTGRCPDPVTEPAADDDDGEVQGIDKVVKVVQKTPGKVLGALQTLPQTGAGRVTILLLVAAVPAALLYLFLRRRNAKTPR